MTPTVEISGSSAGLSYNVTIDFGDGGEQPRGKAVAEFDPEDGLGIKAELIGRGTHVSAQVEA